MGKKRKQRSVVKEEPLSPSRRKFLRLGIAAAAGAGLAALFRRNATRPSIESTHVPEHTTTAVFKPDNKRIKLVFHFGSHVTKEHGADIEPLLKKYRPQVVCTELAAKSETDAREFEDLYYLSKLRPLQGHKQYMEALRDVLRRNGRPRVFSLERFSDRESKEINEKFNALLKKGKNRLFISGKSSEAISDYRNTLESFAELTRRRNREIKRVMTNLHGEVVSRFPELSREKKLTILVRYGTAHAPIFNHALAGGFGEVIGKVPELASVMRYEDPSLAFAFNLEFNLPRDESDAEIARLLLTRGLASAAERCGVGYYNAILFSVESVKHITLGQFKQLSSLISQYIASGKTEKQALRDAHATQNIIYPQSKEEVYEFLRQKRISLKSE